MKDSGLKTLQLPAVVLLVVLVGGSCAVYWTDALQRRAEEQLGQQERQLKEARNQLYQSGEEREVIKRHLDRYLQLQRIGFVGEEQRINWLDGLRVANQRAELFGVDYQISEQRTYPYAAELNPGQLALHQSSMKLRFGLLHEVDLMRFFNVLFQTGAGVFHIDQCTLRRLDTTAAMQFKPNLSAECELSWITVRPGAAERKS